VSISVVLCTSQKKSETKTKWRAFLQQKTIQTELRGMRGEGVIDNSSADRREIGHIYIVVHANSAWYHEIN
jgi:hypothetical protein